MTFLKQAWAWAWPARISFAELEQMQARLLRLLLWLVFGACIYLLLRALILPATPYQQVLLLLAFVPICLELLQRRPQWRRALLWALLLACCGTTYSAAWFWASATTPGLIYLSVFGVFATLLDGPRTGLLFTLLCLGIMLQLREAFPLGSAAGRHLWFNALCCAFFGQLISQIFFNIFGRMQGQLNDQAERLRQAEQERVDLTQALLQGLRPRVLALQEAVEGIRQGLAPLTAAASALSQELAQAATLRHSLGQIDDRQAAQADLLTLRRSFMVALLWLAVLALLTAALRNAQLGDGPVAVPATALGALLLLLAWLRGRHVDIRLVNQGLLILYLGLFLYGVQRQGLEGVPPSLPYLPVLILAAALLTGAGFAFLFGGVGLAVLAWVWARGQLGLADKVMLQNLMVVTVLLLVLCQEVWRLHGSLIQRLDLRAAELAATMRQRRRLLGTLFHDIANPLMVIEGLLQLDAVGVPIQLEDHQRLLHMAERIRQIVDHAETFLLLEARVPDEKMQAVDVSQLFADTQELFEARLRAKRQHLTFSSPTALAVLGLPEVLRDSVLSNLVSNALKFSQAAAGLALEAREQRDEVALVVRDTGPGVPDDVLLALARRQNVVSREGSNGEQGQGLGLSLVQEHLQRLGGRLELKRLPGGGTEARAWLKKA